MTSPSDESPAVGFSQATPPSVAHVVADRMSGLHGAERKVARALLADYPAAGLGTAADLAKAAGVSAPTAVRFAVALGFDGFAALHAALLAELRLRGEGPLGSIDWDLQPEFEPDRFVERAQIMADNAVASLRKIPVAELDEAVDLLASAESRLLLTGGRYSSILAKELSLNLQTIRPNVHYIEDPFGSDLTSVMSLHKRDVYVLFDFHRYQRSTVELARQIRRRKATLIVVTDERMSPAAADARVVLPVTVSAPSPFHTFSAGILLIELLVPPVLQALGQAGADYLAEWETLRSRELLPLPE